MAEKKATAADANSLRKYKDAWANRGFDTRIYNVGGLVKTAGGTGLRPDNGNTKTDSLLQRGYMVTADTARTFDKKRYRVDFLYNPSTVDISNSLDTQQAAIQFAAVENDPTKPISPISGSCAFNLLFDRTFEVGNPEGGKWSAAKRGVLVDIDALYFLVGINQKNDGGGLGEATEDNGEDNETVLDDAASGSADVADSVAEQADAQAENAAKEEAKKQAAEAGYLMNESYRGRTGIMGMTPVKVIFGQPDERYLTYYGYINDLSVSYTHWTQNMTPVRAAVSISMQMLPESITGNADSGDD
ncbi:hypothetical protein [Streptomyces sp. NBC_00470]|uniref:hypothetical protein n=1 Tax=Streptomyces sp. NBC_00470 TaxID=2975753 RepID=UPI0030E21571